MKSKEYLEEIRKSPGLVRAVLRKIGVSRRTVTFFLVTDTAYSPEDKEYARGVSQKYVPEGFIAQVNLIKSLPPRSAPPTRTLRIICPLFPLPSFPSSSAIPP